MGLFNPRPVIDRSPIDKFGVGANADSLMSLANISLNRSQELWDPYSKRNQMFQEQSMENAYNLQGQQNILAQKGLQQSATQAGRGTLTFAGDTTGTLDNDNAASFLVQFALAAGSDYTSGSLQTSWGAETTANRYVGQVNLADSTSNEWYMTGLQVEAGDTASEFEFLPYDVNLQRCKRYFEICGAAFTGGTSTTTNVDGSLQYSVNKRSDNGQSYSLERTTSALANPGVIAINAAAIAAVDSRRTNVGAYLSITVGATTADRKVSTYYQNWLKVDDEL